MSGLKHKVSEKKEYILTDEIVQKVYSNYITKLRTEISAGTDDVITEKGIIDIICRMAGPVVEELDRIIDSKVHEEKEE